MEALGGCSVGNGGMDAHNDSYIMINNTLLQ